MRRLTIVNVSRILGTYHNAEIDAGAWMYVATDRSCRSCDRVVTVSVILQADIGRLEKSGGHMPAAFFLVL